MRFPRRLPVPLSLILLAATAAVAQTRPASGAAEIKHSLDKLNVLGSVLMIAAHPDDENTALLAWCVRQRKLRTAYLSLTRGEGGQNLIGSEQGDGMGVIRTQELLAARRIDGAGQLFTRAIDFGFSKSAEETLAKWGRERILGDVAWSIRRFQPDVIVLRFSGTPRDGHGQHQSSAMLAKDAFAAAADPARFPEQLRQLKPWQAKRVLYNVFAFGPQQERDAAAQPGRIEIDTGDYDAALGLSYSEIAGMSRSQHRSQGMGSAERRGPMRNSLVTTAGEPATRDLLDGVDTSWSRVPGGAAVGRLLTEAARGFSVDHPEQIVAKLVEARAAMASLTHPWVELKRVELDETIAMCAGLWLDAVAARHSVTPGSSLRVNLTALNRSRFPLELAGARLEGMPGLPAVDLAPGPLAYNRPSERAVEVTVPPSQPISQPYWLRRPHGFDYYDLEEPALLDKPDNSPVLRAVFRLRAGSQEFELTRPVIHRYVDRVRGELTRPLAVVPPVAVEIARGAVLFPDAASRSLEVQVRANVKGAVGQVRLEVPTGWLVTPESQPFQLAEEGQQQTVSFAIAPPREPARAEVRAVAFIGENRIAAGTRVIGYEHIPPQTLFPPAQAALVRADARVTVKRAGYVMGAGDEVPDALRQLGMDVTLLSADDLARGDLGRFDAIVTGVRAYNVRDDLRANQQRLLDWVERGGTLVVQYNVLEGGPFGGGDPTRLARLGPYPLRVGRERVAVEDAPVRFLHVDHPLLQFPNRITTKDLEGWVQERGLYFATEWDARYQAILECSDPGEKPLAGGTLYAPHGKGAYVFTAYSWFRQLPAGVPGAYRMFANLISAGRK